MAGRKPTPKPDLLSTLLGRLGLAQPAKKGKKKRRKGPPRPAAHDAFAGEVSAFAGMPQESGLGFAPETSAYEAGYEAAAAAGYAPPPAPPPLEPLFPDAPPAMAASGPANLPNFGGPAPFSAAVGGSSNGLFNQDALDSSLDDLFAGLESGTAPAGLGAAPDNIHDASRGVPASGGNIVPFPAGGFDAAPPPPAEPVAAGTSRLPRMPEPEEAAPTPAAVKAPSRPLPVMPEAPAWDAGSPTPAATVLTLSQGQDLRTLLATIDRTAGVSGSLLVGYDGLIIATTLPPTVDRDFLGAQACAMFSATTQQMERLERGELRRMVLETSTGAMLMTAADMGILVVVSDGPALETRAIAHAIAGALGQG